MPGYRPQMLSNESVGLLVGLIISVICTPGSDGAVVRNRGERGPERAAWQCGFDPTIGAYSPYLRRYLKLRVPER